MGANLGNSVASSSGQTPITAALAISGWCINSVSSCAGGTGKTKWYEVGISHYPRTPDGTLVTLSRNG